MEESDCLVFTDFAADFARDQSPAAPNWNGCPVSWVSCFSRSSPLEACKWLRLPTAAQEHVDVFENGGVDPKGFFKPPCMLAESCRLWRYLEFETVHSCK